MITNIPSFPDPRYCSNPEGIIALGGSLNPETLLLAYRSGIFPWPIEGLPMAWFCPPERAILQFSNLHIPRSLNRAKKKETFSFRLNQAFSEVISQCAKIPRPGQEGTWITDEMLAAYTRLHELGFAHSIEAYENDQLVGGIYGVECMGTFSAESMFYRKSNASKLCILYLMEHLYHQGLDWIDIQMMTPHLEALGAKLMPRSRFLKMLAESQKKGKKLFLPHCAF